MPPGQSTLYHLYASSLQPPRLLAAFASVLTFNFVTYARSALSASLPSPTPRPNYLESEGGGQLHRLEEAGSDQRVRLALRGGDPPPCRRGPCPPLGRQRAFPLIIPTKSFSWHPWTFLRAGGRRPRQWTISTLSACTAQQHERAQHPVTWKCGAVSQSASALQQQVRQHNRGIRPKGGMRWNLLREKYQ
jgi:hypothetical protein